MTNPSRISTLGLLLNLDLYQGASLPPIRHYLFNADGSPFDLTGCTIVGQIRKKSTDAAPTAAFDIFIAANPLLGWYEFSMPAAAVAAIIGGDKITDIESLYEFGIKMTDTVPFVRSLLYGPVRIKTSNLP